MKESITIKNFGGLKNVTIELNSINIFIGKQASGKSVAAKLIYFFRKIFEDMFDGLAENKTSREINDDIKNRFKKYFPVESWSDSNFSIEYKFGDDNQFKAVRNLVFDICGKSIKINCDKQNNINLDYSKVFNELRDFQKLFIEFGKVKENIDFFRDQFSDIDKTEFVKLIDSNPNFLGKSTFQNLAGRDIQSFCPQTFVPAGRSYFSNIQSSVFMLLARGEIIDPFVIEFGEFYERKKQYKLKGDEKINDVIRKKIEEILGAKYFTDNKGEYLIHNDGRKVPLLFCSSGQQESLPLTILIKYLLSNKERIFSLYIEEPEAHLFPTAQKKIVEIISTAYNLSSKKSQMVITTHSPYILTSFNNLLQAGHLLENGANKRKLFKIVPESEILKPGELNAYAFENGDVTSLIDEETGLISAEMLDQVSEDIAVQFDQLLDL